MPRSYARRSGLGFNFVPLPIYWFRREGLLDHLAGTHRGSDAMMILLAFLGSGRYADIPVIESKGLTYDEIRNRFGWGYHRIGEAIKVLKRSGILEVDLENLDTYRPTIRPPSKYLLTDVHPAHPACKGRQPARPWLEEGSTTGSGSRQQPPPKVVKRSHAEIRDRIATTPGSGYDMVKIPATQEIGSDLQDQDSSYQGRKGSKSNHLPSDSSCPGIPGSGACVRKGSDDS